MDVILEVSGYKNLIGIGFENLVKYAFINNDLDLMEILMEADFDRLRSSLEWTTYIQSIEMLDLVLDVLLEGLYGKCVFSYNVLMNCNPSIIHDVIDLCWVALVDDIDMCVYSLATNACMYLKDEKFGFLRPDKDSCCLANVALEYIGGKLGEMKIRIPTDYDPFFSMVDEEPVLWDLLRLFNYVEKDEKAIKLRCYISGHKRSLGGIELLPMKRRREEGDEGEEGEEGE